MKVLVTAGAGYVGSHAVRELIRSGIPYVVLDNFVRGHREWSPTVPLEAGLDLTNQYFDALLRGD